jgi:hypothetical protein
MISSARPGRPAGSGRYVRGPRRWDELAARADDPEAQRLIRRAIRAGAIRVVPGPDGGIRAIRAGAIRVVPGPDGGIQILTSSRRPRPSPPSIGAGNPEPPCPAGIDDVDLTSLTSPAPP